MRTAADSRPFAVPDRVLRRAELGVIVALLTIEAQMLEALPRCRPVYRKRDLRRFVSTCRQLTPLGAVQM